MGDITYINKDFVSFSYSVKNHQTGVNTRKKAKLYWGDKVEILGKSGGRARIKALELFDGTLEGTVKGNPFDAQEKVMRFSMVDVQQGDGLIFETPPDNNGERKILIVDSGENKLFARHFAARFQHKKSTKQNPMDVEMILITHGDADHFQGLTEIKKSETTRGLSKRKRVFIRPKTVLHNGLVKRPGTKPVFANGQPVLKPNGKPEKEKRTASEMFGKTQALGDELIAYELVDDPRDVDASLRNIKFNSWVKTINHWETRGAIDFKRVAHGMDADDLFAGLAPLKFEIQGPFTDTVDVGGSSREGLRFFHKPKDSVIIHEGGTPTTKTLSASHTINGHSISLRVTFGNVRINLTGDHNQESMALMRERIDLSELKSEIVKAPHHGSADFDYDALKAMSPVVSIVSSGDENKSKEHIHPRATLMAALGRVSRTKTSILLSTELTSFFAMRGYAHTRQALANSFDKDSSATRTEKELNSTFKKKSRTKEERTALPSFFGFERTNFGIIHIRTDGKRVLVFTHSGKEGMREDYAFTVSDNHRIKFEAGVRTG